MNERIRKLVVQSEIQFHNLSTGNGDNWQFTGKSEDLEKFAKLIVKDCANFTDPVTRNLMMKHFGVE